MDLISDLLPEVPSLLDHTNPLHNMTLLTNTFIGAFLGTFIGSLAGQTVRHVVGDQTVRHIIGELVKLCHLTHHNSISQQILSDSDV